MLGPRDRLRPRRSDDDGISEADRRGFRAPSDSPSTAFAENAATLEPLSLRPVLPCGKLFLSGEVRAPRHSSGPHPDFPLRARALRVLWSRPYRQLVGGFATYGSKWRFAKARPEPDFK